MKKVINVDKTKKYLLACSFGPDSMALFKILLDNGISFEVAHVNYHKRKESDGEEKAIKEYCAKHNILCHVLDANKYVVKGNFQAWARDLRYDFFKQCCDRHSLEAVFVAHHQDDLIESYLIQKQRNAYVNYYGISAQGFNKGIKILRPLLDLTKRELQQFDDENKIPYSIDVSNLTDHYTRNKIRHSIIEKLSQKEREEYLKKIEDDNKHLNRIKLEALDLIEKDDCILVSRAKNIKSEVFAYALFELMKAENVVLPISFNQIEQFRKNFESKKANISVKLNNDFCYVQEYGEIKIIDKNINYKLILEKPCKVENKFLKIDFSKGAEDRNVFLESYPIVIEPASKTDKYRINNYEVNVSRLFLDWKMPMHLRSIWPVIKDSKGNIIYIPRYRKEFKDNHKSIMRISLK